MSCPNLWYIHIQNAAYSSVCLGAEETEYTQAENAEYRMQK